MWAWITVVDVLIEEPRVFHTSPPRHPSVRCVVSLVQDVMMNIYKISPMPESGAKAALESNSILRRKNKTKNHTGKTLGKTFDLGAPASSRRSADPHRERSIPLLLPPSRGSRHGVAETKCALIGGPMREAYWSDVSTFSFLFLFCSFPPNGGGGGGAAALRET